MNKSSIEITDQAYLIRLNKEDFNYAQVRAFLRQLFTSDYRSNPEADQLMDEHDDLLSRFPAEFGDRFDHLSDK